MFKINELAAILQLFQDNWALFLPIILIQFILMVVALVDCFKHDRTNGPQWIWILIIVFINIIGPIVYFVFGRRND